MTTKVRCVMATALERFAAVGMTATAGGKLRVVS